MSSYYSDDVTQTSIAPTFSQLLVQVQPLGSNYIYSINYVTSLVMTLLMPPSTKSQTDFITFSSYDKSQGGTID